MYKALTTQECRQHFGVGTDYKVDGLLVAGDWDVPRQVGLARQVISGMDGGTMSPIPTDSFLRLGYELRIRDKLLWYFVLYGGALVSEFTDLACRFGSEKNILIGTCGGLKEGAKTGDLIVPTEAFKDGSMSTFYDRSDNPRTGSDPSLSASLTQRLQQLGHTVHGGPTMTCQAMMGETKEDVLGWAAGGYIGVDMETATLLAVANHYQRAGAAVLSIADNLIEGETVASEAFLNVAELRAAVLEEQYRVTLAELAA